MMVMVFQYPQNIRLQKVIYLRFWNDLKRIRKVKGWTFYSVKEWDYLGLCDIFEKGLQKVRKTHIPSVFHIQECTQPYGHSTSGSHERYKSVERLKWEQELDCITHFQNWIISKGFLLNNLTYLCLLNNLTANGIQKNPLKILSWT